MTSRPLKIDLLIESTGGGSARHVLDLFEHLLLRGHDTRLIISMLRSDSSFLDRIQLFDQSNIIRLDMHRSPHPSDLLATVKLFRNLGPERRKRLLHAHSTKAGLIGTMARGAYRQTFFTPHAFRGMDPTLSPLKRRAISAAEFALSSGHKTIIAVSPEEYDYAIKIGLSKKRVRFIPNGVDVKAIADKAAAGTPYALRKIPVIGFAGRMVHQKNPVTFLQAFCMSRKEHPELTAVMIGDGPLDKDVTDFIENNGIASVVRRLGHVDFVQNMNEMDILVHTSHYESLPYVLLEACSIGMPVVAVRNSGTAVIFGEESDLVDNTSDARGLADRISRLVASPDAMDAARGASIKAVGRFSIETMVDNIVSIYESDNLSQAN